ncbi:MAG: hypothetical protein GY863_08480 [bacterium]|nr:hypothetical protein [bacterium]
MTELFLSTKLCKRYKILSILIIVAFLFDCSGDNDPAENEPFWVVQDIDSEESLRGVYTVDDNVIWASGSNGTYARTIDGGDRWYINEYPEQPWAMDFRDVHAFDERTTIILKIASPAVILKTSNSGLNWHRRYYNDNQMIFFNSMSFWDDMNGIVVGDPIEGKLQIIVTEDRGESWNSIPAESIPAALPGEMQFAASGTCLTVFGDEKVWIGTGGAAARIFYSGDRGKNWEVFDTPITSGAGSKGIFSVAFKDELNGIIIGGDYQEDELRDRNCAVTSDGGKTWRLIDGENRPFGFRSCVAYIPNTDGKVLAAVGTSGTDFSIDGGLSWTNVDTMGYNSISVSPSGKTIWAVGADGRIAKSTWLDPDKYKNE